MKMLHAPVVLKNPAHVPANILLRVESISSLGTPPVAIIIVLLVAAVNPTFPETQPKIILSLPVVMFPPAHVPTRKFLLPELIKLPAQAPRNVLNPPDVMANPEPGPTIKFGFEVVKLPTEVCVHEKIVSLVLPNC
jgi:hypothetical protein